MEAVTQIQELLPLLIPLIILELGLRIYAIIDLMKEDRRVRGDNKIIWVLVIGLVNFGWLIYFLVGRKD